MNDVIMFLKLYQKYYQEYFINNRLAKCKFGYTCDIDQVYCHLNKVNIEDTIYYKFYNLSNNLFNLKELQILEVGAGKIPILSSIYKKNNLLIDAIDKTFIFNNYNGINTIEYDLLNNFDYSKYDLIIGIRPCEITENVLINCYKYGKDFLIYLCPCIHKPISKISINTYKEWLDYLENTLSNFKNYKISFINEPYFVDNCPIILGKKINKI